MLELAARLAWGIAAVVLTAAPAVGFVPGADRVSAGVAEANRTSGRVHALALELELRGPDGSVEASGRVRLDPGGGSTLELHEVGGSVETHRWEGELYRAERDGRPLVAPRPLLPPLGLLQAGSGAELRRELLLLGGDPSLVELGLDGERDCYVLGGRERAQPGASRAALWVDVETLDPVRIDLERGIRYRLGPTFEREGIRFPSWVEVQSPGGVGWNLAIRGVARAGQ